MAHHRSSGRGRPSSDGDPKGRGVRGDRWGPAAPGPRQLPPHALSSALSATPRPRFRRALQAGGRGVAHRQPVRRGGGGCVGEPRGQRGGRSESVFEASQELLPQARGHADGGGRAACQGGGRVATRDGAAGVERGGGPGRVGRLRGAHRTRRGHRFALPPAAQPAQGRRGAQVRVALWLLVASVLGREQPRVPLVRGQQQPDVAEWQSRCKQARREAQLESTSSKDAEGWPPFFFSLPVAALFYNKGVEFNHSKTGRGRRDCPISRRGRAVSRVRC
mmetsp:Transcript_25492/g.43472  ORF Transcript_25492/g.43472 Transcript_25492/m.43472 type:complete len:277 (+) Transcript_25492:791-1621(+)